MVVGIVLPELPSISLSGATKAVLIDLAQPSLEVEISGAGDVQASGTVDSLTVDISGAGSINAKQLIARVANVRVSGAGAVRAYVRERVRVRVSGAADAKIFGNPTDRNTEVSGVGNVKFK
ncbi:hypothetical protein OR16_04512 [Cupriavidus basilensis OR16]|uniref:Putative auto-transporter adhesin head GIN domain-containing protein n=1 Tax=Cupriavidus basilensis OR16 TaxID=1127483 RepID=H1RZZ4_9BURK|nr:DUF2807 domain-containing protein [Cupriavidus basilensis]EHP44210.1 hypothetical protein OR16_04512 [Cupriavidus basilensis OR16]